MRLDGKAIAREIEEELKAEVSLLDGRPPCLAVVLVGDDPASHVYVGMKKRACERVGMRSVAHELPGSTSQSELLSLIQELNTAPDIDGILVQLPVPDQIAERSVIQAISPEKDVDGFHPFNSGKLLNGDPSGFVPCTPLGVQVMLQRAGIDLTGQHVVIIGRSNIVGKPLAALLMQNNSAANATVTVLNSKTKNLESICRTADVIVTALGRPGFLTADLVKEGAIVVDVGINRIEDAGSRKGYRLVGDADYAGIEEKCAWITPVPGGVGPMTVAMLLNNTLISYKRWVASIKEGLLS